MLAVVINLALILTCTTIAALQPCTTMYMHVHVSLLLRLHVSLYLLRCFQKTKEESGAEARNLLVSLHVHVLLACWLAGAFANNLSFKLSIRRNTYM